jgi:DNA invertase Pin-like site-specific DNA recombinase
MSNVAHCYIRYSSAAQGDGDSERRQLDGFRSYCTRQNLTPGRVYIDRGRSAFKKEHLGDKGELRKCLDHIEDGSIKEPDTLVVEALDRLGRQEALDAFTVFSGILLKGIRIVTISDRYGEAEYKKEMGTVPLMTALMYMAGAHDEIVRRTGRVAKAIAQKQVEARKSYQPMGAASCPLWLRLKSEWRSYAEDGSAYEKIPERADVVWRIFQMAIAGKGKMLIAKALNEAGVPSFKAGSKKLLGKGFNGLWGTSSIDKILKNRAVFGEYQPTTNKGAPEGRTIKLGDPVAGYFPSVLSVSTFYEAQKAIDGRRTAKATKQSVRFNVWQGVAKCEKCGGALHMVHKGVPPKGGSYLRCANIGKGGCKAKHYRLEETESVFRGMLVRLDSLSLVQDSSAAIEKDLRATEGARADEKRKLDALEKHLIDSPESEGIGRAVAKKESEVKALEKRCRELEADLAAEQGISWVEFLRRLDLVSYEGRARANAVVKRQGVIVLIGPSGYMVAQNGEPRFQMDFRDGQAGYLTPAGFKGEFTMFMPVDEVPRIAAAEDAYYAAQDAQEADGEQLTDAEAAVLEKALDEGA